jgi:GntR family transcriptional regulator
MMKLSIDIDAAVPPFEQLIAQIKGAVLSDALAPGDALPSIRQLANDLGLNPKTVAKGYRLLERDAVVETKGYRGTFVHPDARANSAVDRTAWIRDRLDALIEEFRDQGVTDAEIRSAFGDVISAREGRG